jgi:hypothetical protein
MKFGPVPPKRLPVQDAAKVLLLAERWQRAAYAHNKWAERAKVAVDFFEGRQWTEAQLKEMMRQKRPALKFNIIAPLVRLVLGYNGSNKTDIVHRPGQDSRSSEDTAEALTKIEKALSTMNSLEFVDTEVFLDGLITGRGYYDSRLAFEDNDFGEIKDKAWDPFQVFPDPDADTYDLNESASFMQTAKMVSIDEIEAAFGKNVAGLLRPFTMGQTPLAPISSLVVNDQLTPIRTFGERDEFSTEYWDQFYSLAGDFVDTHRKTIRIIETQHKVSEERNVVIDLETGDKKVLPDDWSQDKIQKVLLYGQQIGNPLIVERRLVQRIQWTTMAADMLLYDAPSLYDRYTITGFFPYFRRGMTRGMVEDLIDPQMEKNKRRSARVEIMSKTANGGWTYHESSLDPVQERKLQRFGSTPGVNIKWKGTQKPEQIQPTMPPMGQERLEKDASDDLRQISGINESALGELDRVQSGRAIEARQRQAVLSIQMYMDNNKRTKTLLGNMHLSIIQNHYTDARIYRVMGEDGKFSLLDINKRITDPSGSTVTRIVNDVTVGKYVTAVDDAPLSATFLNAQFEEMLMLVEKMGPAFGPMLPMFADLMIDMSSLPRKDEWIERFKAVIGAQAGGTAAAAPAGGAPHPAAAQPVPTIGGPSGPNVPFPGAP